MVQKRDQKEQPSAVSLVLGVILIFIGLNGLIGLSGLSSNTDKAPMIGLIVVGAICVIAFAASSQKTAKKSPQVPVVNPRMPIPPEAIRMQQAAAEEQLRDQAVEPDAKEPSIRPFQPSDSGQAMPQGRSWKALQVDETRERMEELRSLLDAGIITEDEYRIRKNNLTRNG